MGLVSRINFPLFVISVFLISSLLFYQASVIRFYNLWLEDGYTHGFLLLAVCVYIFYKQWVEKQARIELKPDVLGILAVVIMSVIWAAASVTFVEKLELIGFLLLLPALFVALLGWKQAKQFFFPFFLLLFAAPVVELFNNIFRKATAILSGAALDITGLTVLVDGFLIQIPVGTFEVDTGCSGIRVVTVGMILSLLYVYINRLAIKDAVFVVGLGLVFSFLSNIIRVYIIVIAGHMTNMQHPLIEDHANLGWIVFAIVMSIYYYLLYKFYPPLRKPVTEKDPSADKTDLAGRTPHNLNARVSFGLLCCFFAIGTGPAMGYYLGHQEKGTIPNSYGLPPGLGDMKRNHSIVSDWAPEYKFGAGDYHEQAVYQNGSQKVHVHIRRFLRQTANNEAINVNNRVYARGIWSEVSSNVIADFDSQSLPFPVEETEIHKGNYRVMLVWRWYETNGLKTGDSRIAKLYNLLGTIRGEPSITVYICSVEKDSKLEVSRKKLAAALSSLETGKLAGY